MDPALSPGVISSVVTDNRLQVSAITLISYDYLVTLPDEISFFWRCKATGATALFIAMRYLALFSYPVLGAASMGSLSDTSCSGVIKAQAYTSVSQYLVWALFSSMRALALSSMNYVAACIVFALAAVPFAVNIWMIAHALSGITVPVLGCTTFSDASPHQQLIAVAVSRSCLIASDFLVVAITWNYTLRESRLRTRRILHRSLMTLLHVHGILYFLLMATLNILHLVLTLLSIFVTLDAVSEVVVFTDPLVAIVTWRFLLALQVANQGSEGLRTSSDVTADDSASLRFVRSSRLTGSVGGSLADNVAPHASRRFLGERETDDSDGSYPAMDTGEHLELKGNTDNEQGVQVVGRDGRLQRY